MIKGFLLDIDGTLLDSNEAHAKAWEHALKHFGYDVSSDEVLTLIGMGGDRVLPALVPGLDKEKGKGKEISDYRKEYLLKKVVPRLKPTKGARELVSALKKRKIKLVVATSASSEEFKKLLQKAKVDDLLSKFTTASDVKASKPAPDVIEAALRKIKLKPEEVLMLGDTPYDIAAAKKNGIKTIALRSGGFSDDQLKGAIAIFDSPKDLLNNLDKILEGKKRKDVDITWEKVAEEKQGKEITKTFKLPDNTMKSFQIRNEGKGASIVALTKEKKVIMVRQYRPGPEKVFLDLPGGFIDKGEKPLDAAKRELLEETGYTGKLKELGKETSSAYSNEEVYCFLATDCKKVKDPKPDDAEFLKVELIDISHLRKIVDEGKITNAGAAHRALQLLQD